MQLPVLLKTQVNEHKIMDKTGTISKDNKKKQLFNIPLSSDYREPL